MTTEGPASERLRVQSQLREARSRVARLEAEKAALGEILVRLRADVDARAAELDALRKEGDWLREQLVEQAERAAELGERIDELGAESALRRARLERSRHTRGERLRMLRGLEERLRQSRGDVRDAQRGIARVAQEIARLGDTHHAGEEVVDAE